MYCICFLKFKLHFKNDNICFSLILAFNNALICKAEYGFILMFYMSKSVFNIASSLFWLLLLFSLNSIAGSRIKDIVDFEGVRDNVLVGYGLVSGLDGTGDNLQNSSFTQKGLVDLLEKLGINTRGENIKTKNVAAVMVTATLPGFSRSGSRISVNLSTLGDAKSLKGGTLLATPLMGIDGNIYAVAQGQVSIGRLSDTRQDNFKPILTSGYVINGALIEKEVHFKLNSLSNLNIALKNPDITTARSIANAINSYTSGSIAKAQDPGTAFKILEHAASLTDLVHGLNSLGVKPNDLITILKSIQQAGALQAVIEVR